MRKLPLVLASGVIAAVAIAGCSSSSGSGTSSQPAAGAQGTIAVGDCLYLTPQGAHEWEKTACGQSPSGFVVVSVLPYQEPGNARMQACANANPSTTQGLSSQVVDTASGPGNSSTLCLENDHSGGTGY